MMFGQFGLDNMGTVIVPYHARLIFLMTPGVADTIRAPIAIAGVIILIAGGIMCGMMMNNEDYGAYDG